MKQVFKNVTTHKLASMPRVGNTRYPYTAKGKHAAKAARSKARLKRKKK